VLSEELDEELDEESDTELAELSAKLRLQDTTITNKEAKPTNNSFFMSRPPLVSFFGAQSKRPSLNFNWRPILYTEKNTNT
jgi:hypothetical protein